MDNSLIQAPKAQKEILEAFKWYEEEQPGLGDRFANEVRKKIALILENPLHYPLKGKYREIKIEVFPFLIIYKYNEPTNTIIVVSVFHTSRHPKNKYRP
jgi:plasmid stabilization system protein ParE